jgi:hypothetical protein
VRGERHRMEAADSWLIAHLRHLPRRRRFEDLLFDRSVRALDIKTLVDHVDSLEAQIAVLVARLQRDGEPERPPGHVLFFPTPEGYAVVEADEPPPTVGQLLLLEHGCFRVQRIGRSPFPRDRRPGVFLEAESQLDPVE